MQTKMTKPGDMIAFSEEAFSATVDGILLLTAFQPIFRLQNGAMVPIAFESLVRPVRNGMPIFPGQFFSKLTDAQMMETEKIMRRLHVRNARALPAKARRLFLNLNPTQLGSMGEIEPELDAIGEEARASGLSPRQIICEITEQKVADKNLLSYFVHALRERGYVIAVDDFGAESANIERVKALTPDIVKFDGRIVRDAMKTPPALAAMTNQIAAFAKDGIHSLLEGLEAPEHVFLAEKTGASYFQGFALAKPQMAPADFDDWMSGYKTDHDIDLIKRYR